MGIAISFVNVTISFLFMPAPAPIPLLPSGYTRLEMEDVKFEVSLLLSTAQAKTVLPNLPPNSATMKTMYPSDVLKQLVSAYKTHITELPLRNAFAPPYFDHEVVVTAWQDAFSAKLACATHEEVCTLSHICTKLEIQKLVSQREPTASWEVLLKNCKHAPAADKICSRCKNEYVIARLAFMEDANLNPQDPFGRENGDRFTAQFWAVAVRACDRCQGREYTACLCPIANEISEHVSEVLLAWSSNNAALAIDIGYLDCYQSFVMRHVLYEDCMVCHADRRNLELPSNKRICWCDFCAKSKFILKTLMGDSTIDTSNLPFSVLYMIMDAAWKDPKIDFI
ncbi:hypothetical protein SVAN01_03270 [Stagonosporopsis vannaccii]|nr:hypothetical protein SVAN01_03270 [Stagonosporopsis vannaccii]